MLLALISSSCEEYIWHVTCVKDNFFTEHNWTLGLLATILSIAYLPLILEAARELKAAFTRQTKVGKLKLICVKGTKQSANKLANYWQQIELASILANFVGKLDSDV